MPQDLGFNLVIPGQFTQQALVVSLLSVGVLVGLFFYLNHYTRRVYFTLWAAGWLFYALWLTLNLSLGTHNDNPWVEILKLWSLSTTALFLFWGGARFLGQRVRQRLAGLFFGFLFVWSYCGVVSLEHPLLMRMPIFGLIGLACLRVGYCFLAYRRRRQFIGASLLAMGFGFWGLFHAGFPFLYYLPDFLGAGFVMATVLQLFIAVSMIVLVLEEVRQSHHLAFENLSQQTQDKLHLRTQYKASEDRYQSLFENAGEPILIARAGDLRILEMNRAAVRLLGREQPVPAGQSLLDYCANLPAEGGDYAERLQALHPLQIKRADGRLVPVEVTVAPIQYEDQPAVQMFFHELTERARLEQQLRQTEKLAALGQMISGIAHELNNPLTVVKGYLELILGHRKLEPEVRVELEKVTNESNRAAKLVQNFLAFAREHPPQREMVQINKIVERVLELRKFAVRVAGVSVATDLLKDLPATLADADQIQQVLVILVNNALQAMAGQEKSGRLHIATQWENGRIYIRVTDNGPGIPPNLQEKIFEPFFSTKEVGAGTGLGLSIAHSIMMEHGGKIYLQPPASGGAGFVLELPVAAKPGDAAEKAQPMTPEKPVPEIQLPTDKLVVLVLDDEPAIAEMVGEMLEILGCQATTCTVPQKALSLIQQQSFNLIFSDIRMPAMDGRQFYAKVREHQPDLAARIIFLTGDTVNDETRAFLTSVGNLHLGKPFQLEALRKVIARAVEVTACHPM